MEIFLDISRSEGGRLIGGASAGPTEQRLAFSGTLELIALLERLLDAGAAPDGAAGNERPHITSAVTNPSATSHDHDTPPRRSP